MGFGGKGACSCTCLGIRGLASPRILGPGVCQVDERKQRFFSIGTVCMFEDKERSC